jgi:hypothetical protein
VHGLGRNRRGPSAQPASGKDRVYKPMVKSPGGQRESEGAVVPVIGVQHNAPGGKGPCFDRVSGEGKRQGMTGGSRSNSPGGPAACRSGAVPPPVPGMGWAALVNVRELQRKLWAAAKQSPERRFHALYDRIHRGDVLWEAWHRVKENRGAAGVDRVTLAYVQDVYGAGRLLSELQRDLREGTYRPAPARRVEIPKPDGSKKTGSTGTGSTGSAARSAIRGQRNHAQKIIGKPYAGKPHVRIERGMGKRAYGTAPLTTNG